MTERKVNVSEIEQALAECDTAAGGRLQLRDISEKSVAALCACLRDMATVLDIYKHYAETPDQCMCGPADSTHVLARHGIELGEGS